MAALYIVGALIVIIYNYKNIPYAFASIFVGAFAPQSVVGGAAGATVKLALTKGVARGLFSNEAGMGSTPHAHAVAKVNHPVEQGYVAMAGVFIDIIHRIEPDSISYPDNEVYSKWKDRSRT